MILNVFNHFYLFEMQNQHTSVLFLMTSLRRFGLKPFWETCANWSAFSDVFILTEKLNQHNLGSVNNEQLIFQLELNFKVLPTASISNNNITNNQCLLAAGWWQQEHPPSGHQSFLQYSHGWQTTRWLRLHEIRLKMEVSLMVVCLLQIAVRKQPVQGYNPCKDAWHLMLVVCDAGLERYIKRQRWWSWWWTNTI